jgi:hypothetical protein
MLLCILSGVMAFEQGEKMYAWIAIYNALGHLVG